MIAIRKLLQRNYHNTMKQFENKAPNKEDDKIKQNGSSSLTTPRSELGEKLTTAEDCS